MKICLIGKEGQLGVDLQLALKEQDVLVPPHATLDVTDEMGIRHYMETHRPNIVINTSAFHDVPKCELDPVTSFAVNAIGPRNLARACRIFKARLLHISTDYVFGGTLGRPYEETDAPAPLMVYGASKLAGEHLAISENPDTIIVRTTGLFGKNPCRAKPGGRNFVELMLYLGREKGEVEVVTDQKCCPTYTPDLSFQLAAMVLSDAESGVYHAVTPAGVSWYDFAKLIFETADMDVKVVPVTSERFPGGFRRPKDSRMACRRLEACGLMRMHPLHDAIKRYLKCRA